MTRQFLSTPDVAMRQVLQMEQELLEIQGLEEPFPGRLAAWNAMRDAIQFGDLGICRNSHEAAPSGACNDFGPLTYPARVPPLGSIPVRGGVPLEYTSNWKLVKCRSTGLPSDNCSKMGAFPACPKGIRQSSLQAPGPDVISPISGWRLPADSWGTSGLHLCENSGGPLRQFSHQSAIGLGFGEKKAHEQTGRSNREAIALQMNGFREPSYLEDRMGGLGLELKLAGLRAASQEMSSAYVVPSSTPSESPRSPLDCGWVEPEVHAADLSFSWEGPRTPPMKLTALSIPAAPELASPGCHRDYLDVARDRDGLLTTPWDAVTASVSPKSPESPLLPCHLQSPNKLYKTELCRSWGEIGSCRYGPKCQFAHGKEELRAIMRHPKYKTELCRTFSQDGTCPYGTRCRFIHRAADKATPSPADGIPAPISAGTQNQPGLGTDESGPSTPTQAEQPARRLPIFQTLAKVA